jgi:hypothetical protein
VRIRAVLTHSAQAIAEGALISVLVVGLMAGTAFAAKGAPHQKTGGNGSIALAFPLVVDLNSNGTPNYGDTVTFNISTTATTQPFVNLVCAGGLYVGWRGYFTGSLDTTWNFSLGSGGWTGGATDCTAWLGMYTKQGFQRLASTSFHVDA